MKLWEKGIEVNQMIEKFTIGKDQELDMHLAKFDVLGTIAHIQMLTRINLLDKEELPLLKKELVSIYQQIEEGKFSIDPGMEDIHSQVEWLLTAKLGDMGKKVHSGRSRNDQVLLDMKLYMRDAIAQICKGTQKLFNTLIGLSEKYKEVLLPGYTHFQLAMPSSFGLWFGAYAESLTDDLLLLQSAYRIVNQNPLGSGAGYGSSFPLNRQMTTELLGFEKMNYNVVYAQMGRGKSEKITAFALSSIAATLGRLSMDICLYMSQNFAFVSFPDELTTGSSIMPHKKNPDVFELIRAKCNQLQAVPNEISLMMGNLPSGYHRDMQLMKESIIPAFETLQDCLAVADMMLGNIQVSTDIVEDEKYTYLFTVEEVNAQVLKGIPFREAYKNVAAMIKEGSFVPNKNIEHRHEGSIGNLCNEMIVERMGEVMATFHFEKVEEAYQALLG